MSFRNTLIATLLFLGIGGYVWFVERDKVAEEAAGARLFEGDAEDAVALRVVTPDETIVLRKKDGSWFLEEPLAFPADETAVTDVARALLETEVKRRIEEEPESLAVFGLSPPKVSVELTLEGEDPFPLVHFGKKAPVGGSVYARLDGSSGIVLLPGNVDARLSKGVDDFRDRRVLAFGQDAVDAVSVRAGEDVEVSMVRSDDGWKIDAPRDLEADASAIRTYLSSLRSLRADELLDPPFDLEALGLDEPRRVIELDVGGVEHALEVGAEAKDEKQSGVYVRRRGLDTVYRVGAWTTSTLEKGLDAFRDKTVLELPASDVAAIEIARKDGETVALRRQETDVGANWAFADGTDADSQAVSRYLDTLGGLSGFEVVAENPDDLAPWGLDAPDLVVSLRDGDGESLGEISVEAPGASGDFHAVGQPGGLVLKIRRYLFDQLDREAKDFRPAEAPAAES